MRQVRGVGAAGGTALHAFSDQALPPPPSRSSLSFAACSGDINAISKTAAAAPRLISV